MKSGTQPFNQDFIQLFMKDRVGQECFEKKILGESDKLHIRNRPHAKRPRPTG